MAPQYSTSLLLRHEDFTFSVDASQLSNGGRNPMFGQVFEDSCDEGLILVSHVTGKEMRMLVEQTHYDNEGDITHWTLRSYPNDERRLVTNKVTLKVWNT